MKRTACFPAVFLCFFLFIMSTFPIPARAAESAIDVSTACDGYFTVLYQSALQVKMKVGVTRDSDTVYYCYVPGTASTYAFTGGNGEYTITLYRNVSGTTYRSVTSTCVDVEMDDPMAPYLASTDEITFSANDTVGQKAAELCSGLTGDGDKVAAIYRYMAANFTYDHTLGRQVARGEVVNYVPDTAQILEHKTGICYDFSTLFAAMCRSQGIPCAIAKGYLNGGYHAWNMVYVDGVWNAVDITRAISNRDSDAASLADCITALDSYTDMSF